MGPRFGLSIKEPNIIQTRLALGSKTSKGNEGLIVREEISGVVPSRRRRRTGNFNLAPVKLGRVAHVQLVNIICGSGRTGGLTTAKEVHKGATFRHGERVPRPLLGNLPNAFGLLPLHLGGALLEKEKAARVRM